MLSIACMAQGQEGYYLDLAREWTAELYERSGQPKKAAEWTKP